MSGREGGYESAHYRPIAVEVVEDDAINGMGITYLSPYHDSA